MYLSVEKNIICLQLYSGLRHACHSHNKGPSIKPLGDSWVVLFSQPLIVTSLDLFVRKDSIHCNDSHVIYPICICDRISYNKASTHTKSNLRFYQKWIAGLIHYHISHCTSFSTGKSGFCSSFLPTLSKPRV